MNTGRTPVTWLRAFEVAARHLSLSAAAVELSVTPAAVSQQVRLLEHRLGQPLFVRHARGLRLTLAGEALVPACRESFERLDTTLTELFGRRQRAQLVVRVPLGFARPWLLDRIAAFAQRHPELPVRVVASVWDTSAGDLGVDVDVRLATGPTPGLEWHRLTNDEVFAVCAPQFARARPRLHTPADVANRPLLTTIGFAQGWKQWFSAAGLGNPPGAVLEFDSMRLALETAALGHGIALARSSYAEDLVRSRRLVPLFDTRLTATDNLYVVHAPGLGSQAAPARFRDWLLSAASLRWGSGVPGRGRRKVAPRRAHRARA